MTTDTPTLLLEHPRYHTLGVNRHRDSPAIRKALGEVQEYLALHPDSDPVECPCGTHDDVLVTECDRNGLPCRLKLCQHCGLIRVDPQPSEESLAWFYAHAYREILGAHQIPENELFAKRLWKGELIRKVLDDARVAPKDGPIVDVGCGGGWALQPLQGFGCDLVGYDFDERMLGVGRARGLDLRHGGVEEATRDGVQAALLVCAHVLEHTKDPVAHLESLRPLVREGGHLYLEVPHVRRVRETMDGDALLYWQRAHLWDFQREHVEVLARRAGWDPVYSSEDSQSVYLVCVSAVSVRVPMPTRGKRIASILTALDRQRTSFRTRLHLALRSGYSAFRFHR